MPDVEAGSGADGVAAAAAAPRLAVVDLGLRAYAETLDLQRAVARARITGRIADDVLLLVEHHPVVTLGRSTRASSLPLSPADLGARGVEVYEVERGGDVTFHGPGQLVGYPVLDLKRHRRDLHWYLRQVEAALIAAVEEFGIAGERSAGFTGVWTTGRRGWPPHPPRKLASIGVHARDWVTWHGFALNVATRLSYFDLIVPCGIPGVDMTSISRELDDALVPMRDAADAVVRGFATAFGSATYDLDEAALLDCLEDVTRPERD